MFIRTIDEALARLLRERLPLPAEAGDISFAVPDTDWAAALGRPTVNLFLYEVCPSGRPAHAIRTRVDADGRPQRRAPLPVVELKYLVSAWGPEPLAEHQLLGDLVSIVAALPALPEEYFPTQPVSSVNLFFGGDDDNHVRDIWYALGGRLRGSFSLSIATAAESFGWADLPPAVREIAGRTTPAR